MVIHFKTSKERLDFLKGKHKEVVPVEIKPVEVEEPQKESKPNKSTAKDKKKDGKVSAK